MHSRAAKVIGATLALALAFSGLTTVVGPAPAAQAATAMSCLPNTFYTGAVGNSDDGQGSYGRIYQVSVNANGTIAAATTGTGANGTTWGWSDVRSVNGLGIGAGGSVAYAIDQVNDANTVRVLRYTPGASTNGTYDKVGSNYVLPNGAGNGMIAGAVDPVNGRYYFGGYSLGGDNQNRFYLYSYNPTTAAVSQVGYIAVPDTTVWGNGDIAFDAAGNLYLLYARDGVNKVMSVTSANVTAGSGNNALTIGATLTPSTATTRSINGIALGADGFMYIQSVETANNTTSTQVTRFDPNTGVIGSWTTLTGLASNGVDLAGCGSPGSLSVSKDVKGRVGSGDQFTVSVERTAAAGVDLAAATTTGTATGVQAAKAGPVFGVAGQSYRIEEAASGTTNLGNYVSTYRCVNAAGTSIASGTGTSFTFTYPTAASATGVNVDCTFTNTPATLKLTNTVVNTGGGTALPTAWTLTATNASNAPAISQTPSVAGAAGTSSTPAIPVASAAGGTTYVLSATGPAGYAQGAWSCVNGTVSGNTVTVLPGTEVSCTITNTFQYGQLTVVKSANTPATPPLKSGDVINYTITATNSGNLPLSGISITDQLNGRSITPTATGTIPATLPAGNVATWTASYTVSQSDIDGGSAQISNTATVTGRTPANATVSGSSTVTTATQSASPALTTTKSITGTSVGTGSAAGAPGSLVNYSITATNTGTTTLTEVAVTDPKLTSIVYPAGFNRTLLPGASVTVTGSHVITQAEFDAGTVKNIATSTAKTPAGATLTVPSAEITYTVPAALRTATFDFTKTVSVPAGNPGVGTVLTYSFTVKNTGSTTLSSVAVTDPMTANGLSAITFPAGFTTLAPNATVVATATYTVKQSDIDAGSVLNTATATVGVQSGITAPAAKTSTATASLAQAGGLTLTKVATPTSGLTVGSTVSYAFTVTNTGNTTLTDVVVTDQVAGVPQPTMTWPSSANPRRLLVNQSATGTVNYTITQADFDAGTFTNTAISTGKTPANVTVTSNQAVTPVAMAAPTRGITIKKTASPATGALVDSDITYSFEIKNTGTVTLTGVAVTDAKVGTIAYPAGFTGSLAPGATIVATAKHKVTQDEIDAGSVKNTATVAGTHGGVTATGTSGEITTPVAVAAPRLTTVKSASPTGNVAAGSVVAYSVTTTNSGNVTLTGVTITDPLVPSLAAPAGFSGTLLPGASVTATGNYTVTQADVNAGSIPNTATAKATAKTPAATAVTSTSNTVATSTVERTARHSLTKTANPASVSTVGQQITYTFTAKNEGSTTLTGVAITDPMVDLSTIAYGTWPSGTAGTLQPGQSVVATATYSVKQSDLDAGSIANTAKLASNSVAGVTKPADETKSVLVAVTTTTGLEVVKTVESQTATPLVAGSKIVYGFTLKNTGSTTLKTLTLTDAKFSPATITIPGTLAPQATTAKVTREYTVTQADIDNGTLTNTATARALTPQNTVVNGTSNTTTSETVAPARKLTLSKTAARATGRLGDTITYTFVVKNEGNVTESDVVVTDPLSGLSAISYSPAFSGTLAPGASATGTATYAITQSDIARGYVPNTATATAKYKTATTTASSGQVITYTEIVTPTAAPDTSTGTQGVAQTKNVIANDTPSNAAFPYVAGTLVLVGAVDGVVTVPNQGTYSVVAGALRFTPLPTFSGTATAAGYRVADTSGTVVESTYTPTVTPVAVADATSGPQGIAQTVRPLANDTVSAVVLVPGSLVLVDAGGASVASVVVPNQGTYSISGEVVTFTPLTSFIGTATPVSYQAKDSAGNVVQSTYTPTLTRVTPTAVADTTTGTQGAKQSSSVLGNDTRGNDAVALDQNSIVLLDAVDGVVTVAGQGTYSRSGATISFQPLPTYVGTATPVRYRMADVNGTTSVSTYTPTVTRVAVADSSTGSQGLAQSVNPLTNDVAPGVTLVPATLTLVGATTIPGQGSYSISDGRIVFTPVATFVGTAAPVSYQVADSNGNVVQSSYTAATTAVTPAAKPDTASGPQGVALPAAVVANDEPGVAGVPLVASSLQLLNAAGQPATTVDVAAGRYSLSPTAGTIVFTPAKTFVGTATAVTYRVADANGTTTTSTYTPTLDAVAPTATADTTTGTQGAAQSSAVLGNDTSGNAAVAIDQNSVVLLGAVNGVVTVAGQGSYSLSGSTIVFQPLPAYSGTATPVSYRMADVNGTTSTSTYTPTVTRVAVADTTSGPQGVAQWVNPLANDTAAGVALVAGALALVGTTTIPNQGTYSLDNGGIVFTPVAAFVGTATPVAYQVRDSNGNIVQSTYTPTTTVVTPTAEPDTATGPQGLALSKDVVANDKPGVAEVPLVASTLQLLNAQGAAATTVDVAAGQYSLSPTAGTIVFTPNRTFTGTAVAVSYRVADANGTTTTSTYTPTLLAVTPKAVNDTSTGLQGMLQTQDVLAGDTAGDAQVPLVAGTLRLLASNGTWGTSVTVAAGTYTVTADNTVSFQPLPAFTGVATPVSYRVADANGTFATATYTPTVVLVAPTAVADSTTGTQGAKQSSDVLRNDTPGNASVGIDQNSVVLIDAVNGVVAVAGQGTYSLSGSTITFTPLPTFSGTATAVRYRMADVNGTTSASTYTPTVTPVAVADTTSGPQGLAQSVNPLANDTGATLVAGSLALVGTTTIANQGTYSISNGAIVFTPVKTFVGTAAPVSYQVTDSNGNVVQSTYTASTTAVTPNARPDTASGPQGVALPKAVVANDLPGVVGVPLVASSVQLLNAAGQPATTVDVAEGRYSLSPTIAGTVVFTPNRAFVGTATAVAYSVADANGTTTRATYTPTLVAVTPVAAADETTGTQGAKQSSAVLGNDSSGNAAVALDQTSVVLLDAVDGVVTVAGQGTYSLSGSTISFQPLPAFSGTATAVRYRMADANGTTASSTYTPTVTPVAVADTTSGPQGLAQSVNPLTNDVAPGVTLVAGTLALVGTTAVPNQGTYSLDNGRIVFTPVAAFVGTAAPVSYQVTDSNGNVVQSTYTPTTTTVTPAAQPDTASGPQGVALPKAVVANDLPGVVGVPLVASSVQLLNAAGQPAATVDVAEGRYSLSPTIAGTVVFTPNRTFVGTAAPVTYRVADANGTTTQSTYTPTLVAVAPTAVADTSTGTQGAKQSSAVLGNDTTGNAAVALDQASVVLIDAVNGVVAVAGQGTYSLSGSTITFTPLPTFSGTATAVRYRMADVNGTTSASTYTPTVTPVAVADSSTGPQGRPQSVDPLANDSAQGVTLVPNTLTLVGAVNGVVTIPNQGVYSIENGRIVFTPVATFIGSATPVSYQVADSNGNVIQSSYAASATAVTPQAKPDTATGPQGLALTTNVAENDEPGVAAVPITASSVQLLDAAGQPAATVDVAAGRYSLSASAGTIVFTPAKTFVGTPDAVTYRVADANGTTTTSTYTPTITAVTPVAVADATTGTQGAAQARGVLANDTRGNAGVALDETSVVLLGAVDGVVTIAGQGTYSVSGATVTFTPLPAFSGTATAVRYRMADVNGTTAESTYTPTVTRVAVADTSTGSQGLPQSVDPLANDTAQGVTLVPSTLTLVGAVDGVVVVPNQGTYSIDEGRIVFTPVAAFVGTATPVSYQVADSNGNVIESSYTASATVVTPQAKPDTATGPQGLALSKNVAENDVPGVAAVPIVASSVQLLNAAGQPAATVDVAAGRYSLSATAGEIVFTPNRAFTGTAEAATYSIADANGTTTTSTYTPRLTAVTPKAVSDTSTGLQGRLQTENVLADDSAGVAEVPLVATTLRLLAADGTWGTSVTVAEGTYTVTADNRVAFQPLPAFSGVATPVSYRVADANGTVATATYTPTVTAVAPTAVNDVMTGTQGAKLSRNVLRNDLAGDPSVPLDPNSVVLLDAVNGVVVIAGQGTYSLVGSTITFTPLPTFSGTATAVRYGMADVNGTARTAIFTPTITPVAVPDTTTGPQGVAQRVNPLTNDSQSAVILNTATLTLVTAAGTPVAALDVAAGRYTVQAGEIVFTPAKTFVGTATPADYQVADAAGNVIQSRYTPAFTAVAPTTVDDETTGAQGVAQRGNVLGNDSPGNALVPLDAATLTLLDGATPTDTLVVDGQGTYRVVDGDVVFTPLPAFTGEATPATYRVADANGTTVTGSYTPTVGGVAPTAVDDATSASQGARQSVDVLANDTAGDRDVAIDADSVRLIDTAGVERASITVAGQGTYTRSGSTVAFTPLPAFTGVATPVRYSMADVNGTTRTALYTPTVTVVARPDVTSGPQGVAQSSSVLFNDKLTAVQIDDATLRLVALDGTATTSPVIIAGQGTYSLDGTSIVFTPVATFIGTAVPVAYRVADADGNVVQSSYTPTLARVTPAAVADAASGSQGLALTENVAANDEPGVAAVPIVAGSVVLLDAAGSVRDTVDVAAGRYSHGATDGSIVFTPNRTFVGTADAVTYRVADANGTTTTATFTPTITAVTPVAKADESTGLQGREQTKNVAANDEAGLAAVALDAASVRLVSGNDLVTELDVAGEGRYTVAGSTIAFQPLPAFTGTATTVLYSIADANGTRATAGYTPSVTAVAPAAVNDSTTGTQGAAQNRDVLANDTAGAATVPVDANSVVLLGAVDGVVTVAGQGSYSLSGSTITFRPLPAFTGTATPVGYRMADVNGTTSEAAYTPTVTRVAVADSSTGPQGLPQSVDPLANDSAQGVTLVPASLVLVGAVNGVVTIPNQGAYSIENGRIVFTPVATFIGTASPVAYRVTDGNGNVIESSYTASATAVTPQAKADTATGPQGVALAKGVVANDEPGVAGVPLVASTLQLLDAAGQPAATVDVAAGRYSLSATAGEIVFTPNRTFTGTADAVTYRVADANGTTTASTYTPTLVAVTPVARPDTATTTQGAPKTVPVLVDDAAGNAGVPLVAASLQLRGTDGAWGATVQLAGIGSLSVSNGAVVFAPVPAFTGTTPAVDYRVSDANGTTASSTLTVTVTAVAVADTSTGVQGVAQSKDVLANDKLAGVTLVGSTLVLLDAAGQPTAQPVVTADGTFSIVDGQIVFAPKPAFTGTAAPVAYRVADSNGNLVQSTLTPTVTPVAPALESDTASGAQGLPLTYDVLANDEGGNPAVALQPGTLELLDANGVPAASVTVAQGVYTIVDGLVVFTPNREFVGTAAAVAYRVADVNGTYAASTLTPTLVAVTPTAKPHSSTGAQGLVQVENVLADAVPGNAAVPIVHGTLTLIDANGVAQQSIAIAGRGVYSVVDGSLAFTPERGWVGPVAAVTWAVADANGTIATSTYAATTTRVTPTAAADSSTGTQGAPQSVDPLVNDTVGNAGVPFAPSSLTLLDRDGVARATVSFPEGVYSVAAGRLVFTPTATYTGAAPWVGYSIADANGTVVASTYSPTVTPVAVKDETTGPQGMQQSVDPLANDTVSAVVLAPATLALVNAAGNRVTTVTVQNQGSYSLVDGRIVFTPVAAFAGVATPVVYEVRDANGNAVRSTYGAVVTSVNPIARDDESTGYQGLAQSVNPFANDETGNAGIALDTASLTLLDGAGNPAAAVTVDAAQGAYSVSGGRIVFTPVTTFVGTAAPVAYRIADANGTTAEASYAPTVVRVTPTAAPDASTGTQGAPQRVAPLANDTVGNADVPFVPASLELLVGGVATPTVTVDGGRYTVSNGRIVFTPTPAFVGTAAAVAYRATDANGTPVSSTYAATVTAVAVADATTGPQGLPQSVNPLANDTAAGVTLVPASLVLVGTTAFPGQGGYSIADGTIVFTPEAGFVGTATPVRYQVQDSDGNVIESTSSASTTRVTPTAVPVPSTGVQGKPQSISPLDGVTPGNAGVPIVASTLTLIDAAGRPAASVTVVGGTYTLDGTTIVFTPLPDFSGVAPAVVYEVRDANGTPVRSSFAPSVTAVAPTATPVTSTEAAGIAQSADAFSGAASGDPAVALDFGSLTLVDTDGVAQTTITVAGGTYSVDGRRVVFTPELTFVGTPAPVWFRIADVNGTTVVTSYTPTVTAVTPTAAADSSTGTQGAVQSVDPTVNDTVGDDRVPFVPSTLVLVNAAGDRVSTVAVAGGRYSVVDGRIVFTPTAAFSGTAPSVAYRVADANGTETGSTYAATVTQVAKPDSSTGLQGLPQAVDPLANDGAAGVTLVPSTLALVGPTRIAGQGVYALVDGTIVFTPERGFVGAATPVAYRVADADGNVIESTYAASYTAVTPTGTADASTGAQGLVQSVAPLANDTAGSLLVPLAPATLALVGTTVFPGQGAYTLSGDRIVFTPEPGFIGTATAVQYRAADVNGTPYASSYAATLTRVTPTAAADTSTGAQGLVQSVDPLANDTVGNAGVPFVTATLSLVDASGNAVSSIRFDGTGTYAVQNGRLVFAPEPGFAGAAPAVAYQVADANGTVTGSTYTATATAVAPVVVADTSTGRQGVAQSVLPLANDTAGNAGVPLAAETLTLIDAAGNPASTVVVAAGTYRLDNGRITFTPLPAFSGAPAAVTYRVADANGTVGTATYAPTVTPVATPVAVVGPQGVPQVVDPLAVAIVDPTVVVVPESLKLVAPTGDLVEEIEIPNAGRYRVVESKLAFVPVPTFVGAAPAVQFAVQDVDGNLIAAEFVCIIVPVEPVAKADLSAAPQGTVQSVDPLANDAVGNAAVPFDPATLTLLDAEGAPATTVTVPEGVYTLSGGIIRFTATPGFVGQATPVFYRVADLNGTATTASYAPTVTAGVPVKIDASGSGAQGSAVTIDPTVQVPSLVPGSVQLVGADATGALVVAGQGVWTVNPLTGAVTFTPAAGFTGDPAAVTITGYTTEGVVIEGTLRALYTHPALLAFTGAALETPLTVALGLLLAGAFILLLARRRRRREEESAA